MKIKVLFLLLLVSGILDAQNHKSIHQIELEKYDAMGYKTDAQWDVYNGHKDLKLPKNSKSCTLNHIVFGWHPYWMGSAYNNYQWDKLSDLAYFAYEVDYTDGSAVSTHSFSTASVIDVAKTHGVRVHLTATLFGNFDNFFANSSAQSNLINNLVTLVKNRGINGVNIDFEGMGSDNKTQFATFIHNLATELHSQVSGSMLSVCLYAVDWNGVFDFSSLNNDVDLYTIMGYDYYYAGSNEAGPTGQLYTMNNFAYTEARSIEYYKYKGAPLNKLVLGVPYYGYDWATSSTSVPSSTSGSGSSKTIKVVKDNTNGYYSNPKIETHSLSKYYAYTKGGQAHQCWVDDEETMAYKYKVVLQTGIAGIGIWALGYDDGYTEMWDLIGKYFTDCYTQPNTGTVWDLGGPQRNYNNHEDYTYTIAPSGATSLQLSFTQFDVENNYDYLYIYDGTDATAPLIGKYSGTTSPGTINASGGALTLRFTSDGATVKPGFTANWTANVPSNSPTTDFNVPTWATTDFTVNFTDQTPTGSITNKFYLVSDYNSEYRANTANGFVYDDFNGSSINSEWTQQTGTWAIENGAVKQSDDGLSNTNLWINATQNSSYVYLYSWKMKLSGTAGNRRGGIHFFCDDATQSNRGNNYMVYYRADNDKVQIYKYANNNYTLETNEAVTINPDQWYNCKVIYNPSTGEIKAFMDGQLVSSWTDPSPYTSGNSVSLRTGNAIGYFDDFRMYKSRGDNATITLGGGKDVRYQNPNPSTPACQISSIIINDNNKFSNAVTKTVNIDWTAPANIGQVNDGLGADIDVISNGTELSANWSSSSDANSDVTNYWYSIGTTAGGTDVQNWTNNSTNTSVTVTGLNLSQNTTYYFNVKAENGAGTESAVTSSDGVTVQKAETTINAPEWASTDFNVSFTDNGNIKYKFYQVLDLNNGEFRANANFGYLNDNFEGTSINSEWTQQTGSWSISSGTVKQSNDGLSNTNLWISAKQTSSYVYLYSWKMKLSGTAGNRRAGIHFFCDDATQTNRGNNYMVYYRADNNKVQIYKYVNDSYTLETDDAVTINPEQWYKCKVIYNPSTGDILAYLDGKLVSTWKDSSPLTSGNSVSLRTGNAVGYFDDFQMYKSRGANVSVTVGNGNEARYLNPDPSTPACKINSILLDNSDLFSDVTTAFVNIDYTPPANIATVNDGSGSDIDVTNDGTQLSANWTSTTDQNSGVAKYWYSVGTSAGATDVKTWTDNGVSTSATVTGLSLNDGTTYYFNVKAENNVGLQSDVVSSDGVLYTQNTSGINAPDWASTDFNVSFNDAGSIQYKFYQISDLNSGEFRSNGNYGFLNDEFVTSSINSEWTQQTGTWSIENGAVKQSNDGLSNTNLWINATQNSSYVYLYSWKMKLSGTAGNRRGGIHFFCDDATQSNRGNNYMVYYRADNDKVQIYKYANNNYTLETNDAVTINPDQWYDCKVVYNPSTGEIKAFMDGQLVSSWTDPSPYTSGNSVSLRVGNAIGYFDDFQMFKSRGDNETVTVGSGKEARYQNPDGNTPACRINSVVLYTNNSFSSVNNAFVNIDYTAPSVVPVLNDGTGSDIDVQTSISDLSANWSASTDPNATSIKYWYAIGTTPSGTDIVNWTDNGMQLSCTVSGLNLVEGQTYYVTLKAENNSGLFSDIKSSDGVTIQSSSQSGCSDCPDIILY